MTPLERHIFVLLFLVRQMKPGRISIYFSTNLVLLLTLHMTWEILLKRFCELMTKLPQNRIIRVLVAKQALIKYFVFREGSAVRAG